MGRVHRVDVRRRPMTARTRPSLSPTDRATNARLAAEAAELDAATITVEAVAHMRHADELHRPGDRFTVTGRQAIDLAAAGYARPVVGFRQPLPAWWPASVPLPPDAA